MHIYNTNGISNKRTTHSSRTTYRGQLRTTYLRDTNVTGKDNRKLEMQIDGNYWKCASKGDISDTFLRQGEGNFPFLNFCPQILATAFGYSTK